MYMVEFLEESSWTNDNLVKISPDLIDVVKDQLYGADYVEEEDPRKYKSQKTDRGPLGDNWIAEYWENCKVRSSKLIIFLYAPKVIIIF